MREFVLTINIAEKFLSGETGSLNLNLRFFFCLSPSFIFFLFACAKEKHTGNDAQPLPDALIKL